MNKDKKLNCSSCGTEYDITQLIGIQDGLTVKPICRKCAIKEGYDVEPDINDLYEELREKIMTPVDFVKLLDKKVKGQTQAKRALAVAVHSHYTRICNTPYLQVSDKPFEKSNIIMTGPSGTGKTLLAKTMAEILDVPFVITNATSLSETGYVGNDVESILVRLLKAANMDVKKAECGIVFIDEIDKKAMKGENTSITRDVSGEGVQSALLKMIEGCQIGVPKSEGRIHPHEKLVEMDTSNILFICGGAFVGIEDIVRKRLNIPKKNGSTIGFKNMDKVDLNEDDMGKFLRKKVNHRDLEKYGMIRELLGRLPIICNLEPLTREDIKDILYSQYGIIEEYKTYFSLQNKKIEFSEDAISFLADESVNKGFGARGLRGIIATALQDLLFFAPSENKTDYIITKEDLQDSMYEYYMEYTNALMFLNGLEMDYKKKNREFELSDEIKNYLAREVYENKLELSELRGVVEKTYKHFVSSGFKDNDISLRFIVSLFEDTLNANIA